MRLEDFLKDNILLLDGAMGTYVQAQDLDVEKDYLGQENCTDILTKSRPDLIRDIHIAYFAAGADAVETNTFGASPITLGEFDLTDQAFDLNKLSAILAREAAESFNDDRPRFVMGSIGPGTKLPSLGQISYQELEDALSVQGAGLIAGGVDAMLIETSQDLLQVKAAINGLRRAMAKAGVDLPIITQVTVETTGTLLTGSDIGSAATVVHALGIEIMGLNCATGPREMSEHIQWLSQNWPGLISVLPNAGLPEVVDGAPFYPLDPDEMVRWIKRFIDEYHVNIVGGCCGTNADHIRALDAMLMTKSRRRPKPKRRQVLWTPGLASLYHKVPYTQENAYFDIGERCNANGSRAFREYQAKEDFDACLDIARQQIKRGVHALDVCTAFVGRDETRDMTMMIERLRGLSEVPLVIDSTEEDVLLAALKLYPGKPLINSMNFEDGEKRAQNRVELARRFGAGLIALTIDEKGMAKKADEKLAIAKRLHDFACDRYGLPSSDLLIDPLTFTICTGNEDDRRLAFETLEAMVMIRQALPECPIILGLSNVSFGINPAPRHVLNSVFLHEALKHGMTGAILHSSQIMPLHKLSDEQRETCLDLIYDRRRDDYDPLQKLLKLFAGRQVKTAKKAKKTMSIDEQLKHRIIDGDGKGLEIDLDKALTKYRPLDIVNDILLGGMKVVGDLFGAGKMQLPFVLQSAEIMKAAVGYLEPFMDKNDSQSKGTMVLATVKGDVHDIGKNLVDIILSNNGYRVVNLGIKQPIDNILAATIEHQADAVGMSGLLVKSTVIMRENLLEMSRRKLDVPVILGGAALNRRYVVEQCVPIYDCGQVAYARDAFDGLALMDSVKQCSFKQALAEQKGRIRDKKSVAKVDDPGLAQASSLKDRPANARPVTARASQLRAKSIRRCQPPEPPFFGPRLIEYVPIKTLLPFLNSTMLYQFHWGYKKAGRRRQEFQQWAQDTLRPIIHDLAKQCHDQSILRPQAVYGYWPCSGQGNDIIIYDNDGDNELVRLNFPRQAKDQGLCLADFFLGPKAKQRDIIALQLVTVGQNASLVAQQWFESNRYRDYLYLHGFGVEMTEALAEYVHQRIRSELGIANEDVDDMEAMIKQGYRGSRYSFGYPACPHMVDQKHLLKLLGAERIGVSLSEVDMLVPEQSTSAIVLHHPQARYFTI